MDDDDVVVVVVVNDDNDGLGAHYMWLFICSYRSKPSRQQSVIFQRLIIWSFKVRCAAQHQ